MPEPGSRVGPSRTKRCSRPRPGPAIAWKRCCERSSQGSGRPERLSILKSATGLRYSVGHWRKRPMKLSRVFVLLASAGLAACGSGKPEGSVAFHGIPANTSKQQERLKQAGTIRDYTLACPQCGTAENITLDTKICPKKKTCGASMFFPDEYVCASCKGTGLCTACVWMDQMPTGECYNCRGKGDLIFNGQARDCPNCKGRKDA